jgi:hypothetical protein
MNRHQSPHDYISYKRRNITQRISSLLSLLAGGTNAVSQTIGISGCADDDLLMHDEAIDERIGTSNAWSSVNQINHALS